jgi:predicted nuclease of restriction endonuclease-like (RecB) superfamily
MTYDVIKDPYLLEFLNLKENKWTDTLRLEKRNNGKVHTS